MYDYMHYAMYELRVWDINMYLTQYQALPELHSFDISLPFMWVTSGFVLQRPDLEQILPIAN